MDPKQHKSLEEDDQFEDFPAMGILLKTNYPLETPSQTTLETKWQDSWEDDDEAQDFSLQLK